MTIMTNRPYLTTIVLFEGFELLDVFGPLEIFSMLPDRFQVTLAGPDAGPVRSSQGTAVLAGTAHANTTGADIVLVPGGIGTRALAKDSEFLGWLASYAATAQIVASVCTGSALLAAAGLLDGYRATSNKRAFHWASAHGSDVAWVPQARWVEDRNRWTSSGVAAGMDMTAALVRSLCGGEAADASLEAIELECHRDPAWDPFAKANGLV